MFGKEIFRFTTDCIAVYKTPDKGKSFVFADLNPAAEKAENISRKEVIDKNVVEIFPEVEKFGLIDVMREVYKTGKESVLPVRFYSDPRISGWRENHVYKLDDEHILVIYNDITPQVLEKSDGSIQTEIFHQFIELIPEIVCEVDLNGRVIMANKHALSRFQVEPSDIEKGLFLKDLFPPSELRKATVYFERLIREGTNSPQEFTALGKNGQSFPVIAYTNLIYNKNVPVGIIGVMIDISNRKNFEKELLKEKTFFENLFENNPQALAQTSVDGSVVKINKEFTRLFGFSQQEVVGKNLDDLLGQESYSQEAHEISRRVLSGKKIETIGIRFSKDMKPVHVSIQGKPVILNGELLGVYGMYRDITKEIKGQKLREVLNGISSASLTINDIENLLGEVRELLSELLDTTNLFIAIYNEKDQTLSFPYFVDEKDQFESVPAKDTITGYVIKTGNPQLLKEKDIRMLEKRGEISLIGTPSKVWLGVPLYTPDGILGVISLQSYSNENAFTREDLDVLYFISNQIGLAIHKIKSREALEQAKKKAEEVAIAKQHFLSTMSHEIRTPLNAVIGMSQLLMSADPRPDQMEFLSALKYSGENLLSLINDILDINKLESEKVELEEMIFSPHDLIEKTLKILNFKAVEKNNTLTFSTDKLVPDNIIGDQVRLGQILTNLVGNALKFTENGKITVHTKKVTETGEKVILQFDVKDTGIGIPKDKLKVIFDSFTQAQSDITRRFGGSGLGLAISKKLVDMQGGTMTVKSTTGKGSVFSFTIVYKKIVRPVKEKVKKEKKSAQDISGKTVLIVEDNDINRLVAKRFLESWNINVLEAEHGEIAVEKVKNNNPDLVLMDLQMPVMDGYQATKRIKSMERGKFKSIPIIALTASVLYDNKEQIDEAGLDGFLLKPFKAPDLLEILLNHID